MYARTCNASFIEKYIDMFNLIHSVLYNSIRAITKYPYVYNVAIGITSIDVEFLIHCMHISVK